jgi:hypothetical protein
MTDLLDVKLTARWIGDSGCMCLGCTARSGPLHSSIEYLTEHESLITEMRTRVGGFSTVMIIDTKENQCWTSLQPISPPDALPIESPSREDEMGKSLSGSGELTRSRIPVAQVGMASLFVELIDGLSQKARRIAEDGGAQ